MDRRTWMGSLAAMAALGSTGVHAAAQPAFKAELPPRRRVAVVLGGGSARGFAHIGVIKALEAAGIKPDLIVGCSAGALVGAFWAAGYSGREMEALAYDVRDSAIVDLIAPTTTGRRGLLSGQSLESFVNKGVRGRTMSGLLTPLVTVATHYPSGQLQEFKTGDIGFAVRASCSIPGIFLPAEKGDDEYLDGGLVSPVPVRTAKANGATFVVAVDVGAEDPSAYRQRATGGMYELILRSFEIMGKSLREFECKQADILIRPDVGRISSTDFSSRKALIDAGFKAGARLAPVILAR
ncbi:MAG: patatin-like phospholipase family protein [Aquabacterium sp.]|nr:patatin-like phospholipase family protein [Aquabacterium sp.]